MDARLVVAVLVCVLTLGGVAGDTAAAPQQGRRESAEAMARELVTERPAPARATGLTNPVEDLQKRIAALEARVLALESARGDRATGQP